MPPAGHGFTKDGKLTLVGGLGWTPATFWSATLTEFERAWAARQGGRDEPSITPTDARRIALAAGKTLWKEG